MQARHSTPLGRRFVLNCRIIPSRPHSQRRWALISRGGRGADLHFLPFSRSSPNTCTGWASLGGRVPPGGGAQSLHRTVGLLSTPGHKDPGGQALVPRHSPEGRQDLLGRDPGWALRTTRGHGSCWSRGLTGMDVPGSEIPMASWRSTGDRGQETDGEASVPTHVRRKAGNSRAGRGPCRRVLQGSCVPLDPPPPRVSSAPCVSQGQTSGWHVVLLRPTSTGAPLESAECISLIRPGPCPHSLSPLIIPAQADT